MQYIILKKESKSDWTTKEIYNLGQGESVTITLEGEPSLQLGSEKNPIIFGDSRPEIKEFIYGAGAYDSNGMPITNYDVYILKDGNTLLKVTGFTYIGDKLFFDFKNCTNPTDYVNSYRIDDNGVWTTEL